jgi:cold shock CspA family protein
MEVPLEITYRDVEKTEEVDRLVREKAAKLDELFENLIACRVAIERPQRAQRAGNPYRIRIDLTAPPGHELVVRREPTDNEMHASLSTIIIDAFRAMRRQLEQLRERQRGEVKTHEEPRGLVVRLFREDGYGFLQTADGRDVYFHRNSVLGEDWGRLDIGTEVRFAEEMGRQGPQASSVRIVAKPGGGQSRSGSGRPRRQAPSTRRASARP